MDEFEVSRRRFVTGAGAASVGLTVALLPSAVAATSNVGGDSGPNTTIDPVFDHSILVGQVFFATSPFAGRDRINIQWTDGESDPVEFNYTVTGDFTDSPRSGVTASGTVTLTLTGWTEGEVVIVNLSATINGELVTLSPISVTFQAFRT